MYTPLQPPRLADRRRAALAIAGTTALALAALSHHPVAHHTDSVQETLVQLVALQRMDGLVHGALIIMLSLLTAGFAVLSAALGRHRPAVMFALSAYALGYCAMVVAMLLDGFAVPQLASAFITTPAAEASTAHALIRAIGVVIQVLTKAGFLSMCAAVLAWSYALRTEARISYWSRCCAVIGVPAGLLPALYLLAADVRLTPASLIMIFSAHAVWNLAAALVLYTPATDRLSA